MDRIGKFRVNIFFEDIPNIDKCIKYINEHEITEIFVFRTNTYRQIDVSFLGGIKRPERIKNIFLGEDPLGVIVLYRFSQLEELDITPNKGDMIDLNKFPKLKKLKTENFNAFKNIGNAKLESLTVAGKGINFEIISNISTIKRLDIYRATNFSFCNIKGLLNLEDIRFDHVGIKNFKGIEYLKNLQIIYIQYARILESVTGISELEKLENVTLDSCPKLVMIDDIAKCQNLICLDLVNVKNSNLLVLKNLHKIELLRITNCGTVPSIKFIKGLENLEYFTFIDTNILDGDLTPCLRLKYVATMDKRHYNLKDKDLPKERTKYAAKKLPIFSVEEILF